jgi:hypothetical protein
VEIFQKLPDIGETKEGALRNQVSSGLSIITHDLLVKRPEEME